MAPHKARYRPSRNFNKTNLPLNYISSTQTISKTIQSQIRQISRALWRHRDLERPRTYYNSPPDSLLERRASSSSEKRVCAFIKSPAHEMFSYIHGDMRAWVSMWLLSQVGEINEAEAQFWWDLYLNTLPEEIAYYWNKDTQWPMRKKASVELPEHWKINSGLSDIEKQYFFVTRICA